jgi:hypothetical protein
LAVFCSPLYPALREPWESRTSPTIKERDFMARIIVTTDPTPNHAAPVLMDESVYSIHLDNEHHAAQLIERLGWAINDAEDTQHRELAHN